MRGDAALRVHVHRTTGPELEALSPRWQALADELGASFASRPSYALAWWEHLGSGSLHVVAAERGDQLVGVAPLHRRTLLGQPVLRWLGHGLGTVGSLLATDDDVAAELWQAVAAEGCPLQLTHVRPDDRGTLALRRSAHWRHRVVLDDRCPVRSLPSGMRAADLRGHQALRRLAKHRRALDRQEQPFAMRVVTDVQGLREVWPQVQAVAESADRDRERENLCGSPYDGFTWDVLMREAEIGNLLVVGGTLGGRWVAHEVALRSGTTVALWLSRFDPSVGTFSVGHLLMHDLVDCHDALGIDVLDFGIGENAYKRNWADDGYDIATVTAVPALDARRTVRARLDVAEFAGAKVRRLRAMTSR